MNTITITVNRIHCASCENAIRAGLGRLVGVNDVRPEAASNTVRVRYDDTRLTEDRMRAALRELGYDPADSPSQ